MDGKKSKRGRRRSATGLRKHQHIDGVVVEEIFPLFGPSSIERKVGDGVYVSATTANNKRFYGVLVDQSSLKEASTLFFQDQSDSLNLNQRMKILNDKQQHRSKEEVGTTSDAVNNSENKDDGMGKKRSLEDSTEEPSKETDIVSSPPSKKTKMWAADDLKDKEPLYSSTNEVTLQEPFLIEERPIQKFKYVEESDNTPTQKSMEDARIAKKSNKPNHSYYRVLVATFSSVNEAACGDPAKAREIHKACESGGNFLHSINDSYYYQYEVLPPSLQMEDDAASKLSVIRTSMGFHSFLHSTALPPWYPLSNLYSQSKVLDLLNLKHGSSGKIEWDSVGNKSISNEHSTASMSNDAAVIGGGTIVPMQPRAKKQYQIGVIGGGIAGLACCRELITLLKNDGIDVKVTLVEARSRLGGRIATDRSWKTKHNDVFPVELGAQWIHGIDDNPLASLAKTAGIEFVKVSEEVRMVGKDMKEVDSKLDEKMGKLFDDLLDHATEDCWATTMNEDGVASQMNNREDSQAAVKWYASCFSENDAGTSKEERTSLPVNTPAHRISNDRSVDCAIGKAISKYKFREFSKLSTEEHRMLLWNSKNVEYALGSNLDNLSMKYWDVDDRHAFEGDHVLLKEGYSAVIEHMLQSLKANGQDKFEYFLDFPVGKVEYGRKSATTTYGRDRYGRDRQLTDLSDSCSITSEDGNQTMCFDFLVSAVPLGVLKESVEREKNVNFEKKMTFVPSLPFSKIDAIRNTGFGLLNKVYIQFPQPFWRIPGFFKDKDDCLFGNVSGVNPHHYMFFDIGKRLGSREDAPAILMSLISGKEAVELECLSDADVIKQVVETLRAMFSKSISIADPIDFRITRWGKDRFSRGSYTYLAPGSTDQDFQILQSPVNANGDSLLLEGGTEVMRLFFAGEHTTALHPSVTHGAMLSGIRAAQEVVANIQSNNIKVEKDVDKVIPMSIFRHSNPTTPLECNLCHKFGGRTREGPLLAFKRGARQVLAHNNCAEFCPEVEVVDFKWKNVIRAVNRGKTFTCCLCSQSGATIGCAATNCYRMFHFSCAEDTAWRFDLDGKVFFCDECRVVPSSMASKRCDRISTNYYAMKNKGKPLACQLCRMPETEILGELLAFQQGQQMCCVHLNCIKYTTIVNAFEVQGSRMHHEYRNVFETVRQATTCSSCGVAGASIGCAVDTCDNVFHYHCAVDDAGWDFQRKGSKKFRCKFHRNTTKKGAQASKANPSNPTDVVTVGKCAVTPTHNPKHANLTFQHNLFAAFETTPGSPGTDTRTSISGNLGISGVVHSPQSLISSEKIRNNAVVSIDLLSDEEISDDDDSVVLGDDQGDTLEVTDLPLSCDVSGSTQLVRLERTSREEFWNMSLQVMKIDGDVVVTVASGGVENDENHNPFSLKAKDIIVSVNGSKVGTSDLKTLRGILFRLKQEVDLMLEVIRNK